MDRPRYTALIFSILIVLIYLIQLTMGGLIEYAFIASEFFQAPWTIITSIFLHSPGDYMHLLNNLFFLALFGFMLENLIGTRRFLIIFLSAGIAANLAAFTFYPATPVLGASGAISGIVAALAVLRPHITGLLWGVPAPMWVVLLGWIGLNAVMVGTSGTTAFEAHLYGLIYGSIVGLYLRTQHRDTSVEEQEPDVDVEEWEAQYLGQ